MTRSRHPAAPPAVLMRTEEPNRQIARIKASLAKRWSVTRMDELFDAVELAWCLVSLGRVEEAVDLLMAVVTIPFNGNYNIWSPVGFGICLHARLARTAGDTQTWKTVIARIWENPVYAPGNSDAVRKSLDEARGWLEEGYHEKSLKWGRHMLGRALMVFCYFEEYGLASLGFGDLYDPQTLEPLVRLGLDRLRARLEGA